MSEKNEVTLIIGADVSKVLQKDDFSLLKKSIADLREKNKTLIPPIHITDEIETDSNCYEIQIDGVQKLKSAASTENEGALIASICDDLKSVLIA